MVEYNEEIIQKINKKLTEKFQKWGQEVDITKEKPSNIYEYVDNFELMERELVVEHRWVNDFRQVYKVEDDFYISIICSEGATEMQETNDCTTTDDVLNSIRRVYPKTITVTTYTE